MARVRGGGDVGPMVSVDRVRPGRCDQRKGEDGADHQGVRDILTERGRGRLARTNKKETKYRPPAHIDRLCGQVRF